MQRNSELYHHGVKGQKWGVRRYQNKDGTLIKTGRKTLEKSITQDMEKLNSSTPVRLLRTQFLSDTAISFIKKSNIKNEAVKNISVGLINVGRYYVVSHIFLDACNDFKNNK